MDQKVWHITEIKKSKDKGTSILTVKEDPEKTSKSSTSISTQALWVLTASLSNERVCRLKDLLDRKFLRTDLGLRADLDTLVLKKKFVD
jgi:hypothetical protein